jgi:hypothetical protein
VIKTGTTLAAAILLLAGCSYSSESNILGWRSSISYGTPGAYPPPSPPPGPPPQSYYSSPPPSYSAAPPSTCWRPGHYNRWGYWVPGRYRPC